MSAQDWSRFSPFLVIFPIAIVFFTFMVLVIYRAFYSDKSWNMTRLAIAGISSLVVIGTLIVSMVSIAHYIHGPFVAAQITDPDAPFTWNFLPYMIVMALGEVILIVSTLTAGRMKTA
jgi:hypothetical protein